MLFSFEIIFLCGLALGSVLFDLSVLVGSAVNLDYAFQSGVNTILIIFGALVFRVIGVYLCVLGTKLTKKERLFCMISYTTKATVQAAIGSIPLTMDYLVEMRFLQLRSARF